MALTINPDSKAPVIANVRITLTPSGGATSPDVVAATPPPEPGKPNPSFYKRYVLNGVTQVHVVAEGLLTDGTLVEQGAIDVSLEEGEAKAAAVTMASTVPVVEADAGAGDAGDAGDAGTGAETSAPVPDAGSPDVQQVTPEAATEASLADVARVDAAPAQEAATVVPEASPEAAADVQAADARDGAAE